MQSQKVSQKALEDIKVNVKLKLAALWASFMFLYVYVDYFHLYMPGSIEDILAGKMFVFDITQVVLLTGLASVTIPALMIFLSVVLTAKVNRWTNIIVAAIYIPFTLFNLAGEAWMHMVFGAVVEVVLLLLIISYSWKWPKQKAYTDSMFLEPLRGKGDQKKCGKVRKLVQIVSVDDVIVQRHGLNAQRLSELAHREQLQSAFIG
ncbi:MAG: DUF6326 family protein [Phormidesmis sp.]